MFHERPDLHLQFAPTFRPHPLKNIHTQNQVLYIAYLYLIWFLFSGFLSSPSLPPNHQKKKKKHQQHRLCGLIWLVSFRNWHFLLLNAHFCIFHTGTGNIINLSLVFSWTFWCHSLELFNFVIYFLWSASILHFACIHPRIIYTCFWLLSTQKCLIWIFCNVLCFWSRITLS